MAGIRKVAVTGGSGLLGRFVVAELSAKYSVTVVDVRIPAGAEGAAQVDVRDREVLGLAVENHDAIVHLAGLDSVVDAGPQEFFDVNAYGTWCVLECAAARGIRDVVICSSVGVYGLDQGCPGDAVARLPIDETQPCYAHTGYRVSKLLGETIAGTFARRCRMNVTSLRLSAVVYPTIIADLVSELREDASTWVDAPRPVPAGLAIATTPNVGFYRSYVEAGDGAQAFLCALENPAAGHRILNVNASDTLVPYPTLNYVSHLLGGRMPPHDAAYFEAYPRGSAFSNERAGREIGWRPRHSWADISKAHFQT